MRNIIVEGCGLIRGKVFCGLGQNCQKLRGLENLALYGITRMLQLAKLNIPNFGHRLKNG